MGRRKMLCERHEKGDSQSGHSVAAGGYHAAVSCDPLPREVRRDDHRITRGYAVGVGQWFFFPGIEPALAFGRAARMSFDCSAYGVYEAAHELQFCYRHNVDERVLLLAGDNLDRKPGEVEHLKRFVQGVKEAPWSAHWHPPTGYLTDYANGRRVKTCQRSLPL